MTNRLLFRALHHERRKEGSKIPEGFEGGEGIAAEGPTIVDDSEVEESSAAEGLFISEGSGEREGSTAVD